MSDPTGTLRRSGAVAPPETPARLRDIHGQVRERGWRQHWDVLGSASALLGTTVVTSALGFLYWAVAARLYSQEAVGIGASAISVMMLLGTVGMAGLGTVLISELPRHRLNRARLVSAGLVASALVSMVLGLGYVLIAPRFSGQLGVLVDRAPTAAVFVLGVAVTGAALVFDQATLGLRQSSLQLWRNLVFAVAKIVLLVPFAFVLHEGTGAGILASWLWATASSLLLVALALRLRGRRVAHTPKWSLLRGLGRTTLAHNWLNIAIQAPRLTVPVVVTIVVSASASGAFYAAWTVLGLLFTLPGHLSTALFAVASADASAMARKSRLTLRVSLGVGVTGALVLAAGATLVLSLFGQGYADDAAWPLRILVLAYVPMIVKTHYVAASRVLNRIPRAALVIVVTDLVEVAAAAWGGHSNGLVGVSVWFVIVMVVEAFWLSPTVWQVATADRYRGRHRGASRVTRSSSSHAPPQIPRGADHLGPPVKVRSRG